MRRAARLLLPLLLTLAGLLLPIEALAQTVTLSVTQNRTSGAAPLAVVFDATATTCSGSCNAFHDLHYVWGFDDDPNAVFATTGKSKNVAFGPVAAHVFETPGTYVVSVSATSASGGTDSDDITITVQDPDVVWSGTNTICFSSSGTFDAFCPSGAQHTTTSSLNTIASACTGAKRCLLRRGETFSGGNLDIGGTGPGMLGAFGPGTTLPLAQQTTEEGAVEWATGTTDWRVEGVRFQGYGATATSVIAADRRTVNVLIKGTTMVPNTFDRGASFPSTTLNNAGDDIHSGLVFWENTWDDVGFNAGGGNMFFVATGLSAWVGNTATDTTSGEHVARMVHFETIVVSNNIMGEQASQKGVIVLRSEAQNESCSAGCQRHSREAVVADNIFYNRSVSALTSCSSNNPTTKSAFCEDILWERNFISELNPATGSLPFEGIITGSTNTTTQRVTIRNNIFHMPDAARAVSGGDWAYGNSCYFPASNPRSNNICIRNTTNAHNNLLYTDAGGTPLVTTGVSTSGGNLNAGSNPYSVAAPDVDSEFQLGAATAAKDAGVATKFNPIDYYGFTRLETGTPDIGAMDESTVPGQVPDPPDPDPDPDPPTILKFVAWDPGTQTPLHDPFTGSAGAQVLDLQAPGFALQAVPDAAVTPGSVVFAITCDNGGPDGTTGTENTAPFAQNDDAGVYRQYEEFSPGYEGTCTLTATPYPDPNGGGEAGTALQVTFDVIDSTPAAPQAGAPPTVGGASVTGGRVP